MNFSISDIFTDENIRDWETFWLYLGNFIDAFRRSPSYETLASEPELTDKKIGAFTAAAAEQLAYTHGVQIPDWVFLRRYYLDEPFFAGGFKGEYNIFLLRESPLPFKARNIFVSANVLDRC